VIDSVHPLAADKRRNAHATSTSASGFSTQPVVTVLAKGRDASGTLSVDTLPLNPSSTSARVPLNSRPHGMPFTLIGDVAGFRDCVRHRYHAAAVESHHGQ
jgi:hypothetical protein